MMTVMEARFCRSIRIGLGHEEQGPLLAFGQFEGVHEARPLKRLVDERLPQVELIELLVEVDG